MGAAVCRIFESIRLFGLAITTIERGLGMEDAVGSPTHYELKAVHGKHIIAACSGLP